MIGTGPFARWVVQWTSLRVPVPTIQSIIFRTASHLPVMSTHRTNVGSKFHHGSRRRGLKALCGKGQVRYKRYYEPDIGTILSIPLLPQNSHLLICLHENPLFESLDSISSATFNKVTFTPQWLKVSFAFHHRGFPSRLS